MLTLRQMAEVLRDAEKAEKKKKISNRFAFLDCLWQIFLEVVHGPAGWVCTKRLNQDGAGLESCPGAVQTRGWLV